MIQLIQQMKEMMNLLASMKENMDASQSQLDTRLKALENAWEEEREESESFCFKILPPSSRFIARFDCSTFSNKYNLSQKGGNHFDPLSNSRRKL